MTVTNQRNFISLPSPYLECKQLDSSMIEVAFKSYNFYNFVPVSDFATSQLNLRKPQNSQKFCKKKRFLFFFKCNSKSKEHFFRVLFLHPSYLFQRKYLTKLGHINHKMGAWWQNLRLVHNSTLNLVLDLKMWEKFESNLPVSSFVGFKVKM